MIYLLRHGEIPGSRPRRFVGQRDLSLTPRGRAQAAWWRDQLAEVEFETVFASDLSRCRQTAEIITGGREFQVTPALREISLGQWEEMLVEQVREDFPGEYEKRGSDIAKHRPAGGESFADLAARAVPALEEISAGVNGDALVVAHAGVNRVILCHALGLELDRLFNIELNYCSLNLLEHTAKGWVVHGVNLRPEVD
jgi:broad specificity phosphatase PhoE